MIDYADIICQAVDEIVSKRLEGINYDNTITCTITNDTNAKKGEYIVSDGSMGFVAYSKDTDYKVNDVVYVTVPNNDFREQKIIIGKQVTNDSTPFIFTTPFDTIVDVSANLVQGVKGERFLIANNPDIPPEGAIPDDEYLYHQNVKRLVWEKDFGDSMVVGFTRLGIQGSFRSWLKSYQTTDGDYGYRLILTCEKDNHETTIATAKRVLKKLSQTLTETSWGELQTSDGITWEDDMIFTWEEYNGLSSTQQNNLINKMADYLKTILQESYVKYELYLSAADMYGDPYNFQAFYQQEKVFDISELGKIINMKLEFYQTPESFLSKKIINQKAYDLLSVDIYAESWEQIQNLVNWPEKYALSYSDLMSMSQVQLTKLVAAMKDYLTLVPYKHPIFDTLVDPNLFETEPYICVGYDLASFNSEAAILYTLDSSTYNSGLTEEENTKQVQLRWLHEFEDGEIKSVSNETDLNFEVRWYQYELGHPTVDGYSGVNWKQVNLDEHVEVDLSKIVNTMKSYYLIYHDDPRGTIGEATYTVGSKIPYRNGQIYTLNRNSESVLALAKKEWLEKHSLDPFERLGFIAPSYSMSTININLDKQSWTNIFKSQMIFHDAGYTVDDTFTGDRFRNVGCLHRVGFWELFTMGYIMYQYCPNEYDQLRVSSLWKNGGDLNENWTKNYAGKNLYTDLGCSWPGSGNATNRNKIKGILHEFANSFGEWDWWFDPEDGWIDYRPKDENVYNELYAECLYFYEKTQTPVYDYVAPNFSYTFIPDVEEVEEKVKAVIIYDNKPIYSNVITFTNERQVDNPATLDQINGLNLWCADNSYGNYRIYNIGGYLEDEDDRNHIRDLEAHFNSKETEASGLLHEATWIMWRIPASGSMIQITSSEYATSFDYNKLDKAPQFTTLENITWKTQVPFSIAGTKYFDGIWSDYMYDAATDEIVSIWKGNSANGFFINPLLEYKIKSYYSPSDSNNTISCVILKDGVQYETQKEFTFGPVGNSGTDWSFEIDFDNNETALTSGNETLVTLTARLYDHTNKDVTEDILYDVDVGASLRWKWHPESINPSGLTLVQDPNKKHKCSISIPNGTTINMNSLLYAQCETDGVGDYTLTAVLPIPIRKWISNNKHYSHVTGATYVTYPSSGYPHYYNNPFKVHIVTKTNDTSIQQSVETGGSWKLFNPHGDPEVFLGKMSDKNILQPAAVYSEDASQYGVQYSFNNQVCWTQPIFTMQNQYPSRALNKWDGKSIEMDYDKGTIIAPAIAAGKKNNDNTFSGVMLGDWSVDDVEEEIAQQTGIYGFDHGAMSYAFKEDGTAFIGKSGFARICIDGNESTIASEGYTAGDYGMLIDLDDGFIDIIGGHENGEETLYQATTNSAVGYNLTRKTFTSTGASAHFGISGDPYFRIVADNEHRPNWADENTHLIEISNTEYYLKSWDFNDNPDNGPETGLLFDLMQPLFKAYNLTLESTGDGAGEGKIHIRFSTVEPNYFHIGKDAIDGDEWAVDGIKYMMCINDTEYYIQSYDFSTEEDNEKGMRIDLNESSIRAYNFTFESKGSGIDEDIRIRFSTEEEDYFYIGITAQDGDGADEFVDLDGLKPLFKINSSEFLLQTRDFNVINQTGLQFNLQEGYLIGYHFRLEAGKDQKKIYITSHPEDAPMDVSEAANFPLIIGDPTTILNIEEDFELGAIEQITDRTFRVGWEGQLIASQARIGGWFFHEGPTAPNGASAVDGRGWRSMYSGSMPSPIAGETGTYYTVLDPKRDNVLAIGIPSEYVFRNHNRARFRVLTDGRLFCSDAHLGYTPGDNVAFTAEDAGSGWIVTENTIYSNGLIATETETEDGEVTVTYAPSTAEEDRFTMSTVDFNRTINGTNRYNLRLAIGRNFAVSGAGYVYAYGSNIEYLRATNATIKTATITNATIQEGIKLKGPITGYGSDGSETWSIDNTGKGNFNNLILTDDLTFEKTYSQINFGSGSSIKFLDSQLNIYSKLWVEGRIYTPSYMECIPARTGGQFARRVVTVDDLDDEIESVWDEISDLWRAVNSIDVGGLGGLL